MNPSVTVTGAVEGCSNPKVFIPELVRYYKEGRLPINKLNKFYDFRDIGQALHDCHEGTVVKPILRF
jgi:aryl-alcohol dehydrogenase